MKIVHMDVMAGNGEFVGKGMVKVDSTAPVSEQTQIEQYCKGLARDNGHKTTGVYWNIRRTVELN